MFSRSLPFRGLSIVSTVMGWVAAGYPSAAERSQQNVQWLKAYEESSEKSAGLIACRSVILSGLRVQPAGAR